eukprot:comp27651_c0_seq1/m.47169 comp27651_c0_seq1/g.47169  ORF comp27651_c0_seq1/g.47169 comp27651_c0_seq1/m.47169 type:complete len:127 (-) comp27651_c0_seq1:126-506(-)
MAASSENEMRALFLDAQDQLAQSQQRRKLIMAQIEGKKRDVMAAEFTLDHVKLLPKATPCYLSVGRMFVKQSHDQINAHLAVRCERAKDSVKQLEQNKEVVGRTIKEKENAMRELLMNRARMQAGQ